MKNHPSWRNKHLKIFYEISPRYLCIYTYSDLWMKFNKNGYTCMIHFYHWQVLHWVTTWAHFTSWFMIPKCHPKRRHGFTSTDWLCFKFLRMENKCLFYIFFLRVEERNRWRASKCPQKHISPVELSSISNY